MKKERLGEKRKKLKIKKISIDKKTCKKIIYKILYIIFIILIVYNAMYVINNAVTSKKYIKVSGVSLVIMPDKTMSPRINKNDFAVFFRTSEEKLKINDVILYDNNTYMQVARITNISEKIISRSFVTKGDNNYYNDSEEKEIKDIAGKYLFKIPKAGWILKIFQSKITTVIIILFLLLKFSYNKYVNMKKNDREKKRKRSYI